MILSKIKLPFSFLLCVFLFFSCKKGEKIKLTKGVSLKLAQYRKQQIADVIYELDFNIPEKKDTPIISKLKLKLLINDLSNDLLLDFNENSSFLKSLKVNGENSEIHHKEEHLIINRKQLILGNNTIEISFDAGELSLNRNDEFLYTLLVPDRASTLFPCFDQPDIKANYKLNITAPKMWKVLCGAFEVSKIEKENFIEHKFKATDKMSSYLFSFVAGKFTEETKNPGAFNMRFLYREDNEEKITESVNKVFNIHQKSMDFLEDYTSMNFPFQKMDFAAIPPFQYGGMEHVGAIQYRASSLFLDKNATQNKKLNRAKLIAHETAHMWFGNLVTMRWFNDVWMKEVFANFMADKIMNPVFPEVNHNLNFMMSHYPSAYSEDRTKGTNAIRQYLGNLKNAGSLYGRIIYNKAPIMMRQLENVLGKHAFKEGIQEYIKTYKNANADWNELVSILDKKSPVDIKNWSDVWVNSSGRPVFSNKINIDKDGKITSFIINQKAEDGSSKIWPQSFDISFVYKDTIKVLKASFIDNQLNLKDAVDLTKPNQIIYNSNGFGYGVFPIKEEEIRYYTNLEDEVSRGYAYINLYENMLNGNISPFTTYQVFFKDVLHEKNELIANYLVGRIQTIFWAFLHKEPQNKLQHYIQNDLFKLLESDLPSNIKKTLFKLYKSIAISSKGINNLYTIWNKEKIISNLFLNESDFTSLAMKLALFKHKKVAQILEEQQTRISNKDRLERFKWLLPSLSNNEIIRNNFMKSLLVKENREKESWTQTALNNIHHPLRQNSSTKHIKACLNILEEIQLTGDIFFPKRWLASSIGNYSSKEAFKILDTFLKEHPNYNPILKKKLLQTVDNLIRAQTIKK